MTRQQLAVLLEVIAAGLQAAAYQLIQPEPEPTPTRKARPQRRVTKETS